MATINNNVCASLLKKLDRAYARELEACENFERAVGTFNKQVARDDLREAINARRKAEQAVDRYYAIGN